MYKTLKSKSNWLKKIKAHIKIIIVVIFISALGSLFTGCGLFPNEESTEAFVLIEPPKTEYKTVEVLKGTISKELNGRGAIIPSKKYNVFFQKHGGCLKELLVKTGDKVDKGQLLAVLDTEDLEYDILEQELKLQKVQVVLKDLVQKKATKMDIEKASLDVKIEELSLQKLENLMDKSKLVSPVSGVINYSTTNNIGDLIEAYQVIFTIVNSTDCMVEYEDANVALYKIGMNARILYDGMSYEGEVVSVQYELKKDDKAHKLPYVTIKFLKKPDKIALGDFTEFIIDLERKDNVLLLSKRGINTSGDYSYVQILENGQVEQRFIDIGIETDTDVEVLKGLKEGDKVIEK
jgi:macrolide-specific efflux system membrane fusion protein